MLIPAHFHCRVLISLLLNRCHAPITRCANPSGSGGGFELLGEARCDVSGAASEGEVWLPLRPRDGDGAWGLDAAPREVGARASFLIVYVN